MVKALARVTFKIHDGAGPRNVVLGDLDPHAAGAALRARREDLQPSRDGDFTNFSGVSRQPMTPEFDVLALASDAVDNVLRCEDLANFFLDAKTRYPGPEPAPAPPSPPRPPPRRPRSTEAPSISRGIEQGGKTGRREGLGFLSRAPTRRFPRVARVSPLANRHARYGQIFPSSRLPVPSSRSPLIVARQVGNEGHAPDAPLEDDFAGS